RGELLVEDVHRAVVEVGGVQVVRPAGAAHGQPLVDRPAGRLIGAENRLGRVHGGVEAGDGAVLGGEEDRGRGAAAVLADHEVAGGVGRLAGGGGGGAGRAAGRRRDDDRRAEGRAVGGEQGGVAAAVVREEELSAGRLGKGPGVDHRRVGVGGQALDVRHEI